MAVLLAIVGLAIKTQFPSIDPDIALIQGFAQLLPSGLAGLAVIIFFAAFMSSIDTYAYTAASSLVHDFFKHLSKKDTVKAIKWAIAGIILFSSLIAVIIQDLLFGTYLFAGYAIILAIPTIATWIRPKIKKSTLNFSLIFGILALTIYITYAAIIGILSPKLVVFAMLISVAGLLLGGIISFVKR